MNIILDGLSGVGKTYIGRLLSEKLDIPLYEFLPDVENNSESSLHSYALQRQIKNDGIIIEGSYIMSELTKFWMYENNIIEFKELLRVKSLSFKEVKPFVVIHIVDDYSTILERRKQRGRKFEFLPQIKDLKSLDDYILKNYSKAISFAQRNSNIYKSVYFSRQGFRSDDDLIAALIIQIVELLK